jgi:hypothetical protein
MTELQKSMLYTAILVLSGVLLLTAYFIAVGVEGPLTEGPYQHRVVCKAVCK